MGKIGFSLMKRQGLASYLIASVGIHLLSSHCGLELKS